MAGTESTERSELESVIEAGFHRTLVVRVARTLWRTGRWPDSPLVALCSAAVFACAPVVAELALLLANSDHALRTPTAIGWVFALSCLNTLILALGWRTWALIADAVPSIEPFSSCGAVVLDVV